MKIEIESKYNLGDVLYHMTGNLIEEVMIMGIEVEKRAYCTEYTDKQGYTEFKYALGYPNKPERNLDWVYEDELLSYSTEVSVLIEMLKRNIQ